MRHLVQDGEQTAVFLPQGKAHLHRLVRGQGRQTVFLAQIAHPVDPVIAHQPAVRLPGGNCLARRFPVRVVHDLPLGEEVVQEGLVAGVPLRNGDLHLLLFREALPVRGPHHGEHFGDQQRVGNDEAPLLRIEGTEIEGKCAVDLPVVQGFQHLLRGPEGLGFKVQFRVLLARFGESQVVRQHAGQPAAVLAQGAERQVVVPVAHADRPMLRDPVLLTFGQEAVHGARLVVFFRHLLVETPVVLEDPVHRHVQVLLQVRAAFTDAEQNVRGADFAYGDDVGGRCVGVQRHQRVDFPSGQHLQQFWRLARQLRNLRGHVMVLRPIGEKFFLDAVLVNADGLAVQRGKIVRPDPGVVRCDEEVVILRSHRLGGIQNLLRPLRGVGNIAEQVDLAVHQLLKQLAPASLDVFILPSAVDRDPLLVFISVAGFPAEFVRPVEGRFVPADFDGLGRGFLRGGRQQDLRVKRDRHAQDQ